MRRCPIMSGAVARVPHALCVFSRARGGRHQVAAGSWPGAGAATRMLLIDSAIARTGVLPCGVFLLWNFGGYWPPVSSIAFGVEDNPHH